MKKIVSHILTHLQEDFNFGLYITTSIFLVVSFFINYYYNFTNNLLNSLFGNPWAPLYFALLMFSLVQGAYYHRDLISSFVTPDYHIFADKIAINIGTTFYYMIPILIYKRFFDKKENEFYGVNRRNIFLRPYFLLLLLVFPLVIIASFQDDFLKIYPNYPDTMIVENFSQFSVILETIIFQFFYLFDFILVELFFRGFLVIGLSCILGRRAILPMVIMYAFAHFGKPLGEAVTSIFGGYILGIIAYNYRNIWGGSIIHCGIAFLMEWAALIQIYFIKNQ